MLPLRLLTEDMFGKLSK